MRKKPLPLLILITLSCMTLMGGCSQQPEDYYESPSIYAVLANPEKYSESRIRVIGYLANHGGGWRLFTDPERSNLSDYESSIYVGNYRRDFRMDECNHLWVAIKGKTQPYNGAPLKFDPATVDYISGAEHGEQCFASERIKNSKGQVIFVPAETSEIKVNTGSQGDRKPSPASKDSAISSFNR